MRPLMQTVRECRFHLGSSFVLHMGKHVGVGVQGERGARMSKLLGHYFRRDSNREGKRCGRMAEIVKTDVRQASFPQECFEMRFDQVLLVDWFAMSRVENQISKC